MRKNFVVRFLLFVTFKFTPCKISLSDAESESHFSVQRYKIYKNRYQKLKNTIQYKF